MVIPTVEIQTDEHGTCGVLSNYTDHGNLAEIPSSWFLLPKSDRTQYPALNLWQ